jgi:hypothetical protein
MSRRFLVASFESEDDVLAATRAARAAGLRVLDTYTPYPVHGLDEAQGVRRSRLPYLCFTAAIVGAALKLWFEYWTATVDWPVNVGGKPWDSLPAFIPVTFEVMVLSAGLSTVLAFLVVSRLRPGRRAALPAPRITDDRFALELEESDAAFDVARVRQMMQRHNAVAVEERLAEEAG